MPQESECNVFVADEAAMVEFGRQMSQAIRGGEVIFLNGDLGMGKTTLCRGVLQGFGHQGSVKSPTYTLVEPYELGPLTVFHFDLYRLGDPEELEYFGIRDYFTEQSVCLIEWPEKGEGILPKADLLLQIRVEQRGRRICCQAQTEAGRLLVDKLAHCLVK